MGQPPTVLIRSFIHSKTKYTMEVISIGPWGCEEGTPFSHRINNGRIQKLVILYEGGFKSLTIKNATETLDSKNNHEPSSVVKPQIQPVNIIKNSDYRQAIGAYWKKRSNDYVVEVISGSTGVGCDNANYVIVSKRKNFQNSIYQDITGEVCVGGVYEVSAYVSVKGSGNSQQFQMFAAVNIEYMDNSSSYLQIGSVFVKEMEWKKLECWFHLNRLPKLVKFYIEGPPPNIDLRIGPVSIFPVTRRFVVKLDPDEYLMGISGYYRMIQEGMPKVISSLTFLSNHTKYGPYGPEEGTPFSFKTTDGEIIGFHGTSNNFLHSVGCLVKPSGSSILVVNSGDSSMHVVSSSSRPSFNINRELPFSEWPLDPGPWGGMNGKPFDDGLNERVKQIFLTRKDKFLSSIQMEYEFHGEVISSVTRGSLNQEELIHRIQFSVPAEYLMQITGYWYFVNGDENNVAITSLSFFSNKQKYGPFGEEIGTFFSSPLVSGKILGFFGRSGKYLSAIGVHMEYLTSLPIGN